MFDLIIRPQSCTRLLFVSQDVSIRRWMVEPRVSDPGLDKGRRNFGKSSRALSTSTRRDLAIASGMGSSYMTMTACDVSNGGS